MLLSRDERRSHLDLHSECDIRGGGSKEFKGLLAHYLNTEVPHGRQAFLCHACHDGKCSNVKHLYWGTPKDNHLDQIENGTFKSLYERTLSKYGKEYILEKAVILGKKRKGKPANNR